MTWRGCLANISNQHFKKHSQSASSGLFTFELGFSVLFLFSGPVSFQLLLGTSLAVLASSQGGQALFQHMGNLLSFQLLLAFFVQSLLQLLPSHRSLVAEALELLQESGLLLLLLLAAFKDFFDSSTFGLLSSASGSLLLDSSSDPSPGSSVRPLFLFLVLSLLLLGSSSSRLFPHCRGLGHCSVSSFFCGLRAHKSHWEKSQFFTDFLFFMDFHVFSCVFMGLHGSSWAFIGLHGSS